jgi:release factor glutamine methyltransferase
MAWALATDRGRVLAFSSEPMAESASSRFRYFVERRCARVPVQYITGEQEFLGRGFHVDPRVLVPRPETEEVAQAALSLIPIRDGTRLADLGTGSGCIAVSLAVERPEARVHALDRSAEALAVARANARRHGVHERIVWARAEFASPPAGWRGIMDLVISNPPYVAADEWLRLEPEVKDHEPMSALVAGPTGDEAYETVIPAAALLLRPDGALVLELGHRSARGASRMAEAVGFRSIEIRSDVRGIARVLVGRR